MNDKQTHWELDRGAKKPKKVNDERKWMEQIIDPRIDDLDAVSRLAGEVIPTLPLNQTIDSTYENILSTVKPDLMVFYLREGDTIISQGVRPENPLLHQEDQTRRCVGQCLCGLVAEERRPVYSLNIHNDPRCTVDVCKNAGVQSFAALPLLVGSDMVGVLGIGSEKGRDFSKQAPFLETLASHVALGLKNAILYEKFKRNTDQLKRHIDEMQPIEMALRESEDRYRDLYDNAPNAYFSVNASDGSIVMCNTASSRILGYDRDSLLQMKILDLCAETPQGLIKGKEAFERLKAGETIKDVELQMKCKQGHPIWVSLTVEPISDASGKILESRAMVIDISDRKKAELELRESEERYRTLIEAMNEGLALTDEHYVFTYVNVRFSEMLGHDREEIIGRQILDLVHDEYKDFMKDQIARRKRGEETSYETAWKAKDGSTVMTLISPRALKDDKGRFVGSVGVLTDISARKKAEEDLTNRARELAALNNLAQEVNASLSLETVVNTAIDQVLATMSPELAMVFLRDGDSLILKGYKATDAGYAHREIPVHRVGECLCGLAVARAEAIYSIDIHNDPRCTWEECKRAGLRSFSAIPLGRRDDIIGVIGIASSFEKDFSEQATFLEAFANSVTIGLKNALFYEEAQNHALQLQAHLEEIKKAQEEKGKLEEQLVQARKMEAVGTLAGGIAHDFNNLLMGIQGNASLILLDINDMHPSYERLKNIEKYIQNGAELTKQLLGFARGGKYEVRPTDMNELIRLSSRMFGRTKKEIRIHIKYQQDIWSVEVDHGQMEQALLNLFVNAWQAMPDGGDLYLQTQNVSLDESFVTPHDLQPGKYVKISITDTGVGMKKETQLRVFEPFFSTKDRGRGTGLGLASVYGIVKNHGGLVGVDSEEGEGATFEIYLPASEKKAPKASNVSQEILKGTGTVLLVDDEEMILDVGKDLLGALGYEVLTAGSGAEALEIFERERDQIGLIILDIIMPDMGGAETYDRLIEVDPQVNVLLSSGYSIDGKATEILNRGCKGFIQKPFTLKELSKKIKDVLAFL